MALPVDMELKKAFQELQSKMVMTQQQIKMSDMQVESHKRNISHSRLVQKELEGLPKETRVFEGIGRMFLLRPSDEIQEGLVKKIEATEEKMKNLEGNKTYLEKSIKESEDSLRELVISKQKETSK